MTFVRHYTMQARDGAGDELANALSALERAVRMLPGSLGVDLLRDIDDSDRYLFIERWTNRETHAAAGAQLPAEVMAAIKPWLSSAPVGLNLAPLDDSEARSG